MTDAPKTAAAHNANLTGQYEYFSASRPPQHSPRFQHITFEELKRALDFFEAQGWMERKVALEIHSRIVVLEVSSRDSAGVEWRKP